MSTDRKPVEHAPSVAAAVARARAAMREASATHNARAHGHLPATEAPPAAGRGEGGEEAS